MAITKKHLKTKNIHKVTFTVPSEIAVNYKTANLVGCFNEWDKETSPMKYSKTKKEFSLTLELESGREYHFRYLLDNEVWINDDSADRYERTAFGDSDNCVIVL